MKRLFIVLAALFTAACGQSGPLYIADSPSRIENPPAEVATEETEEDAKDEKQ